MPHSQAAHVQLHPSALRELYFLNLYRIFQAAVFTGAVFSPIAVQLVDVRHPMVARVAALIYLSLATMLFVIGDGTRLSPKRTRVIVGMVFDIVAGVIAMHNLVGLDSGIGTLLIVNVGACAILLPLRSAIVLTSITAASVLVEHLYTAIWAGYGDRNVIQGVLFAIAYFAAAAMCYVLAQQTRESHELAEQRGLDLANLELINELIIQRMRTGVIVVDGANQIRRMNESARFLLGDINLRERDLSAVAPELSRRLFQWRSGRKTDDDAIVLADDSPAVIPRFARLSTEDEDEPAALIFLDDTSLVTQRAEEMTLASLGRLSASIAHEIRNPLAAISYSSQLLAESEDLHEADRRLVEIIQNHGHRMNAIVENVLQLSRRERCRPEEIDLATWVEEFTQDYISTHELGGDQLTTMVKSAHLPVMFDPQHLHQIVWNLVQNARRYGRMPEQPARVAIVARMMPGSNTPVLEVVDRGPGIPEKVSRQIFEPFYTTKEDGTGLGLYLARQMCEANQASLEYSNVAGGGSCFRISTMIKSTGPRR